MSYPRPADHTVNGDVIGLTFLTAIATAIEHGWRLVTKDAKLRAHRHPRQVALW